MPKKRKVKLCEHNIPKARCERCKGLRFRPVKEPDAKKSFKKKLVKAIDAPKSKANSRGPPKGFQARIVRP